MGCFRRRPGDRRGGRHAPPAEGAAAAARPSASGGDGAGDGTGGDGFGGGIHIGGNVQSISIDPPTASIESLNGSKPTQKFKLKVRMIDGSITEVSQGISGPPTRRRRARSTTAASSPASGSIGAQVNVGAELRREARAARS